MTFKKNQSELDLNPVDVMLQHATPGKHPILDTVLEEFDREAREEWFNRPEDLKAYYKEDFDDLVKNGFLKLNANTLKKHHFAKGKLLALTLTLESVRTSQFLYDFEFGNSGKKEVAGNMEASFDYHAQLGVPESA